MSIFADAEQILKTALAAHTTGMQDYAICVSQTGVHILSETMGWSLIGLAAHSGSSAVYRVAKCDTWVRVEAWSREHTCVLQRNLTSVSRNSRLTTSGRRIHEGSCTARAELIASQANHGASIASTGNRALHEQFQRAYALEQERPSYPEIDGDVVRRGLIGH